MYRSTLLAGAFLALAATAPLRAQELQMSLSGEACTALVSCFVNQEVPFSVSFDLNTLSGQQTYRFQTFNNVGCLSTIDLSNLAITNFSASVGGHSIPSARSLSGAISGTLDAPCSPGPSGYEFDLDLTPHNMPRNVILVWDSGVAPSVTQTQFRAFKDPLESLLSIFFPASTTIGIGSLPRWNLGPITVQISAVPVPEPGVLPLLLLGLAGLGLVHFLRAPQ